MRASDQLAIVFEADIVANHHPLAASRGWDVAHGAAEDVVGDEDGVAAGSERDGVLGVRVWKRVLTPFFPQTDIP